VIAALILSAWMGWTLADPILALIVAGMLAWTAWNVGRRSLDQLMDHELPDEDRQRIRAIAERHASVIDAHDLKTREAGLSTFIQLHLRLRSDMTLAQAHVVSDEVERAIRAAYPTAQIIIHQDPAG
jgi:ferrous-iron efflux pump FieF